MKTKSRKFKSYTEDDMLAAYHDVRLGMSVRRAATQHNVPHTTLWDRVSKRVPLSAKNGGKHKLTVEDEKKLIEYAQDGAKKGIGFSKSNFFRFAGDLASKRGTPFKNGRPSDKWWRLFKKRHSDLSLWTLETTASVRHEMMTMERVEPYFTSLKAEMDNHEITNKASVIWNMDETCITLSSDAEKIVARKGSKSVHSKSGTRETITLIASGNAAGQLLPPHFIFKGKTKMALRSWDTENAPGGSLLSVSPTGWAKQALALMWFTEVFLKNIGPARPQILIFDGHDSHHHMELITAARENQIILVELPSHTSNWLQPFDRTFFGPMKSKWRKKTSELMAETGCTVNHSNFFLLFRSVWMEMASESTKIVNGFAATGICPWNPSAVPNEAFGPSEVYRCTESSNDQHDIVSDRHVADTSEKSDNFENEKSAPDYSANDELAAASLLDLSLSLVDLGCVLNEDGTLQEIPVPPAPPIEPLPERASACPPELALAAVECSLTAAQKKRYEVALRTNQEIKRDTTFQTWKRLKLAANSDDLFETPDPVGSCKDEDVLPDLKLVSKAKSNTSFFILTSDEAYRDKLNAKKRKEEKEKKKRDNIK